VCLIKVISYLKGKLVYVDYLNIESKSMSMLIYIHPIIALNSRNLSFNLNF